jgi:acetyl esterase/lipase
VARLIAIAAAVGVVVMLAAFYRLPNPRKLDLVDLGWPGVAAADQVVTGVAYGPLPRQRLDVWRRSGAQRRPAPVLVWFYGGSWNSGARGDYGFAARAFAEKGFVVVVPDYRLVPSVRYPAFLQDAAAAVAWTRANAARLGGDADRIVLAGHSAGAYLAVMLALDARWLAAAGADADAVKAVAGLAGPYDFYPFTTDASRQAFGQAAEPAATQPVNHARADAPPLWLAAGTADTIVRPRNSESLARRQRSLGGRVAFVQYDGLDHYDIVMALSRPFRGKAPVLDDAAAFLLAAADGG